MLQAIGGVYANEAATFLGGANPFAVAAARLRRTGQNIRSQLQARPVLQGRWFGHCWALQYRSWLDPTLLVCIRSPLHEPPPPPAAPRPRFRAPQAAQAAVQLAQHQARLDAAEEELSQRAAALKAMEEAGGALPEEAKLQLYGLVMARCGPWGIGAGWVCVLCVCVCCV
jgi:hypothetical protein